MNWYKLAKEVKGHQYSWVYIDLPKDITSAMLELGKQIDKDDLFDGEADGGLEKEPHVTVKYGLLTEDSKEVKECLSGARGGEVYLAASSIFETEKYDVVKISVESKALDELHEKLNRLPHEDKYMEYQPHATIAYVKSGRGKKYVGKLKINKSFNIKECYFGNNKKDYTLKLANVFNLKARLSSIASDHRTEAKKIYEQSLSRSYFREVSKKFPKYNSDPSETQKAVSWIVGEIKRDFMDRYQTGEWITIEESLNSMVHGGLT